MDDREVLPTQRRRFLMIILAGLGGAFAAAGAWPVFRFLSPADNSGLGGPVAIPKESIPVGGSHIFNFRGKPAVLLQPEPGQFIALTAVCTHLGCIVKWLEEEKLFLCPCHGGKFSPAGDVMSGPPPAALESYPVALAGDQVLIG